jgi:hypothetical protein
MAHRPLGRIAPETWEHIELYPFTAPTPITVEKILSVPRWRLSHDQGREGSCVGHAIAIERAISNAAERKAAALPYRLTRYDPIALWRAAKAIDEWSFTKPEDDNGTSVRAAYEIARTIGLRRVRSMELVNGRPVAVLPRELELGEGVAEYRWAQTVDATRAAILAGVPVAIGVDWHTEFDDPLTKGRERWLPEIANAGRVRGGHAVTLYGASDRRQAFRLVNSWGRDYPLVWMPYSVLEHLLHRRGEVALVTDRISPA